MSTKGQWINNALEIVVSKSGKPYINIKKDLSLQKGQRVLLEPFEKYLAGLVDAGLIDQDKAAAKMTKQHFVKQIGTVAPMDKEESNF